MSGLVIVDLGCGRAKQPGHIGIDHHALPGVDLVADLSHGVPLRSESVHEVLLRDVLEHVDDVMALMREVHRVLRPGGVVRISVPHFSHARTYADPTHVHFFSLRTVDYLAAAVYDYYGGGSFEIVKAHLGVSNEGRLRKVAARWPYASEALLARTIGVRAMTFELRKR